MNDKMLSALSSAIYVSRMSLTGKSITEDDQRLRASGLYADWSPGEHIPGDIYNADGQTWECYQAYDNAVYPEVAPDNPAWNTFNRPLHGRAPETAKPWVSPTGAHDMYRNGEYMVWTDWAVYRCIADTNFSPEDHPAAWEKQ